MIDGDHPTNYESMPEFIAPNELQSMWVPRAQTDTYTRWGLSDDAHGIFDKLQERLSHFEGPDSALSRAAMLVALRQVPGMRFAGNTRRGPSQKLYQKFSERVHELTTNLMSADQALRAADTVFAIIGPNEKGEKTFGLYLTGDHSDGLLMPRVSFEQFEAGDIKCDIASADTAGINLTNGTFYPVVDQAHALLPVLTVEAAITGQKVTPGIQLAIGNESVDIMVRSLIEQERLRRDQYDHLMHEASDALTEAAT